MDDLVQVQVVLPPAMPMDQSTSREGVSGAAGSPQHLVQLALGRKLHENAVAGSLGAHTPGGAEHSGMKASATPAAPDPQLVPPSQLCHFDTHFKKIPCYPSRSLPQRSALRAEYLQPTLDILER